MLFWITLVMNTMRLNPGAGVFGSANRALMSWGRDTAMSRANARLVISSSRLDRYCWVEVLL